MSTLDPAQPQAEDPWAYAERVAVQHRNDRLHPPARRRRADRLLRPIVIAVWIAAVTASVLSLWGPASVRDDFSLAASAGVVLVLVLGVWWMSVTQRFLVRGSASSIKSALPPGSWSSVKRQLRQQTPLDPRHRAVIAELAHQQRRLLLGSLSFFLFYVPMYIDIVHNSRNWTGPASVGVGAIALTVGAIIGVIDYRRLTHLIQHIPNCSPDIPSSASESRQG